MSLRPAAVIARHSASKRATFSVMLSSTMKMARAPRARASRDICENALDGPRVEVPSAHLDDRAEAAVEGAAARGLDDIDRAADERIAVQHTRGAIREANLLAGQRAHRPRRRPHEPARRPVRNPGNGLDTAPPLEGADQLAERDVPLASHDEVDLPVASFVDVRGEARIVPADDDGCRRGKRSDERGQLLRGAPLKRHDRQPDEIRLEIPDESLDRFADAAVDQNQIGYRHTMVRVDVARQRPQRPVRHPHRHRRGVLEGVGHREQQNVHGLTLPVWLAALQLGPAGP